MVLPDGRYGEVELSHRPTVRLQPMDGVVYTSMPVFTDQRKGEIPTEVNGLVTAGALRTLPRYGAPRQQGVHHTLRRFAAVLSSAPVVAARWCRWCLRSRRRAAGGLGVLFLLCEGLSHWGFFDYVHDRAERASEIYQQLKDGLTESSEAVGEYITTAERLYAWLASWIEHWWAVAYLGSACFLWWAYSEAG